MQVKKSLTQLKAKVKQQPPPAEHRTIASGEACRNAVALLLEPNSRRAKNIRYVHSLLDRILSSGDDRAILAITRLLQALAPVK
jgi:hypothetical protein